MGIWTFSSCFYGENNPQIETQETGKVVWKRNGRYACIPDIQFPSSCHHLFNQASPTPCLSWPAQPPSWAPTCLPWDSGCPASPGHGPAQHWIVISCSGWGHLVNVAWLKSALRKTSSGWTCWGELRVQDSSSNGGMFPGQMSKGSGKSKEWGFWENVIKNNKAESISWF